MVNSDCAFEMEHGLGILTDGERILGIGYQVDAEPLEWVNSTRGLTLELRLVLGTPGLHMRKLILCVVWIVLALAARAESQTTASTTVSSSELGDIWVLGDSVAVGQHSSGFIPGGWREPFVAGLTAGHCHFRMVGSQTGNDTAALDAAGQQQHDGHSGTEIAAIDAGLDSWIGKSGSLTLHAQHPRFILLMIGTNDVHNGHSAGAGDRLARLISDIVAREPEARLIVSTILPNRAGHEAEREAFNQQVYQDVQTAKAAGGNIQFADIGDLIDPDTDMIDVLHPNAAGNAVIARGWQTAITDRAALAAPPHPQVRPAGHAAIISVAIAAAVVAIALTAFFINRRHRPAR
jgi:lysophospholipase L1-like esterase